MIIYAYYPKNNLLLDLYKHQKINNLIWKLLVVYDFSMISVYSSFLLCMYPHKKFQVYSRIAIWAKAGNL